MQSNPLDHMISRDLDIIAFSLRGQSFCVETTKVREIRGWVACTPIPHARPDILGVINLRGEVVPIIDLAGRLGMGMTSGTARSAIVVAEVGSEVVGLLVDSVSDILTVDRQRIQAVPAVMTAIETQYAAGMLTLDQGMICLLNVSRLLGTPGEGQSEFGTDVEYTVSTCH